jgi:peptide/nickel transport system substrate-binding protein
MKNKGIIMLFCFNLLLFFLSTILFVATDAAAQGKSANKVTIAYPSEPDSIIPTDSSYSVTSNPISNNIFERIVDLSTDGKFVPGIASWEVLDGGKEFLFTIRKGVKFHSGDPLTARDVEFSHNRAWEKSRTYKRYMRLFDHLEVIDDYHIKFYFKAPDVLFIPIRILAVESKSYHDRVGEETFVEHPVGTGQYKFVAWKPGEYIEIERNEDYWGEKPPVKGARFVFAKEDTTRVAMLKTGEADIIMSTPYPLVKDLEASGYKTIRLPSHPPCGVQFHTGNPDVPWYDRRVRLAIAYAIDKDAIVKNMFSGIPMGYPRLAPWELGYDPDLKQYPYDPAKAKKLLAEAGYPKGFEMPLYYFAGRSYGQKETAEAVSLYLNAIGIKTKVQGIEAAQMLSMIRKWHADPKAVYVGVVTAPMAFLPDPTEALTSSYMSTGWGSMYFNKEIDPVIDEAQSTMDDKKRGELLKQAIRILHEDVASIQIWANTSVYAMKPNIDFTPTLKNREPLMLIKDVRITD